MKLAETYFDKNMPRFKDFEDKRDYYKSLGDEQIARQVWFHNTPHMVEEFQTFLGLLNTSEELYGVDYGCGTAPIGCELALRGHKVDFIDLEGSPHTNSSSGAQSEGNI